jgi:hypothetical protein
MADVPIELGLTLDQMRERAGWKYRAVEHLRGNQTPLGCILVAFLGYGHQLRGARVFDAAIIAKDGTLIAPFRKPDGEVVLVCPLGHVAEIVDQFRRVCDKLKFSDIEREALFAEFRKWIKRNDMTAPAPLQ